MLSMFHRLLPKQIIIRRVIRNVPRCTLKSTANSVRSGMHIEHDGKLQHVHSTDVHAKGRGHTTYSFTLIDRDGRKTIVRFRADDNIEVAQLERRNYQYLYRAANAIALMNPETFEQIEVDANIAPDAFRFLQEGSTFTVELHNDQIIGFIIPQMLTLEVLNTDPASRNGSSNGQLLKSATLHSGITVQVPAYIEKGESIIINTDTGEFHSRADVSKQANTS